MGPPTRRGFARLLARLDRAAFARFLAALWTARGRPATVVDGHVTVAAGPTIRPHAPPRGVPTRLSVRRLHRVDGADVVATTDPAVAAALRDRGVRVVGPAELRQVLLYDLDRETARTLARDHLGHSLDDPVQSLADGTRDALPGAAVLAVVAAAAVVALLLLGGTAPEPGNVGADARSTDGRAAEVGSWPPTDAVGGSGAGPETVAPGLTTDGVVDADELARAHAEAVRGRSYEWEVFYREFAVRRTQAYVPASRTRTVRVESETEFVDSVRGWGTPVGSSPPDSGRTVYADGSSRFVRTWTNGTASVERYPISFTSDGAGFYADRAASYVRRFVAADGTDVVERTTRGDTRYYRLTLADDRHGEMTNLRGNALVAPSGFVLELRVTYALPDRYRSVSVTFRYGELDATTVAPPTWYPAARNVTVGRNASSAVAPPTTRRG